MRVRVAIAGTSGEQRCPEFNKPEITIGRRPSNDVVLPDAGASSAHARVLVTGGALTILDLDSTNGTYVNDEPVQGPRVLERDDVVQIGDFRLRFMLDGVEQDAANVAPSGPTLQRGSGAGVPKPTQDRGSAGDWPAPPPMMDELAAPADVAPTLYQDDGAPSSSRRAPPPEPPRRRAEAPPPKPRPQPQPQAQPEPEPQARSALFPPLEPSTPPAPAVALSGPTAPGSGIGFEFQAATPEILTDRAFTSVWMRLRDVIATATAGVREQVGQALEQALQAASQAAPLPDVQNLHARMLEEMTADGPIPSLLEGQPDEIVVVGVKRVRINRGGHVSEGPSPFTCPAAVDAWISRVCHVDFYGGQPSARGTFGDYAVQAVHEPGGAVVSLRRRAASGGVNLDGLVHNGVLSPGMGKLLSACVVSRQNVLLCAGPGSSIRPMMAGLLAAAPPQELAVALCNPSLDIGPFPQSAVVLTRTGESALESALALGPDRLAVDELRWDEAGAIMGLVSRSLAQILGVRATTPSLGLGQLEAMLSAAVRPDAARQMLTRSVDIIASVQLFADGVARVTSLAEPVMDDTGQLGTQDIFTLVPGSRSWQYSGIQPRCYQDMTRRGFPIDPSIFA